MTFTPTPEMIGVVHEWRQRRPDDRVRRALVPLIRERFGIGAAEAVEVIRKSDAGGANADAS
jgi:hypothetical protein